MKIIQPLSQKREMQRGFVIFINTKNHINLEWFVGRSAHHLNLERLIGISAHLILDGQISLCYGQVSNWGNNHRRLIDSPNCKFYSISEVKKTALSLNFLAVWLYLKINKN